MLFGSYSNTSIFKSTEVTKLSEHCSRTALDGGYDLSIDFIFCLCLPRKYSFVLFMLAYCYIVIIIILQCDPKVYQISTEEFFNHNIATSKILDGR